MESNAGYNFTHNAEAPPPPNARTPDSAPPDRHLRQLGALQILHGAACMIIGLCAAIGLPSGTLVWHGIWGGICPIIAGSLQITATYNKSKARCMTAVCLCASIVAAASMATIFAMAIISAVADGYYLIEYSPNIPGILISDVLQAVFSGMGCFNAIWSSGVASQFCCGAYKCCWKFWCLGQGWHSELPTVVSPTLNFVG